MRYRRFRLIQEGNSIAAEPALLPTIGDKCKGQSPGRRSPRRYLCILYSDLYRRFEERFSAKQPLIAILARIAYRALDAEREAFPLSWLTDEFLMTGGASPALAQEMVNWLISCDALIPYSGGRASFIHQSITEYCAALELVRLCEAGAFSLRDTVALKKWDQCLFMALGMMADGEAEEILDFLSRTDLGLAFNAVRYADDNQSAEVAKLLGILIARARSDLGSLHTFFALSRLPLGVEHAAYLEEILNFGGSLAAQAVEALAAIRGPSFKPTLLKLIEGQIDDFNFSRGIVRALKPLVDESDLTRLLQVALSAASNPDSGTVGDLLAHFDADMLIAAARGSADSPLPVGLIKPLCQALEHRKDKRSFEILADFILDSNYDAVTALYFRLPRDGNDCRELVSSLTIEHVHAIWRARFAEYFWNGVLRRLCHVRADFAEEVASIARCEKGIERIALLDCLDSDLTVIHEELERLVSQSDAELARQPFNIFFLAKLDWTGTGSLYPRLLVRSVKLLRRSLLGDSLPSNIKGLCLLGPDVLMPLVDMAVALPPGTDAWWEKRLLGNIVGRYGNKATRAYLLDQLAHGENRIRHWIKVCVLSFIESVSTDDMSDDAIAFLLADLSRDNAFNEFSNNPLGHAASERFVSERLIPLARGASGIVLENLGIVLKAAGNRHGRRYLLPN